MENFVFQCKTEIIFGKNTVEALNEKVKTYGKKVLFHHYGDGVIEKIGLHEKVMEILNKNGCEIFELTGVRPNPRLGLAQKGIDLCKAEKIDWILAVGGGSVIDSAKTISIGSKYAGNVWDFYEGKAEPTDYLPLGVILTIPATGSESSDGAVITNEDGMYKRPMHSQLIRPEFSILDPEITYSLPKFQTAAGGIDIMSHVIERYFTPTKNVEFTDRLCEATMKTVIISLDKVMQNPRDYDARADLMWAGSIAHNDLLGTGRTEDWASHMIGHEIGAMFDLAHGATLSVVFPAWMKYVYKTDVPRFAQFAVRVWNLDLDYQHPEKTALLGIERMTEYFKAVGLPTSFQAANIDATRIEELAEKCTKDGNVGGLQSLEKQDVINILKLAE